LPNASDGFLLFVLVVEPFGLFWQNYVDVLHVLAFEETGRFVDLGGEEDATTYHKLGGKVVVGWVVGELVPHWSPDWLSGARHLLECRVQVVDKVVALVDSGSNCLLNSLSLDPGFSQGVFDVGVGTEERIPCT